MSTHLKLLLCLLFGVLFLLPGCGGKTPTHTSHRPTLVCQEQADGAVRCAYTQVGNQYTLGGVKPSTGFDCSGLVYWAYRKNGVSIPRQTTGQANFGYRVSRPSRVGDILVFRTGRSGTGLHTGLYSGNDKFIHSPRPGRPIREESINHPYWKSHLVEVRRLVQ